MKVTTVGLDLAKNVLQVHGVDEHGRVALRRQLKVAQAAAWFAQLPACVVAMEACASAHHWARRLQSLGHTPRLIAPQYVKPYVKTNKNDAADAEAICEAAQRPNMRFVAPKTLAQQAVMALHALRSGAMKTRTAVANRMRGLLLEFGVSIPQGMAHVHRRVLQELEDAANDIPGVVRLALHDEYLLLKAMEQHIAQLQQRIEQWHRESEASRSIERIAGLGPLCATAFVASVGDARQFASGRQLSAWMGIVPRQHSSGGKSTLLGISKRGDAYLRTLFIHGARSVIAAVQRKLKAGKDPAGLSATERWLVQLMQRRNANVAAVALASKNARTAWAVLVHGKPYDSKYVSVAPRQRAALAAYA